MRPPSPPPVGLIGFIRFVRAVQTDLLGMVGRRFEEYGDIYVSPNSRNPLYVTRHPDHIYEVLVSKGGDYRKRRDLVKVLGNGLLTADGETWRRNRRLIQPAFKSERIAVYAETVVKAADDMAAEWRASPERDIGHDMMRLTLAIVGKALFDYDPGPVVDQVAASMDVVQRAVATVDLFPDWVPTPLHVRTRKALSALDRLVYGMIDERRAAIRQKPVANDNQGAPTDLLGQLLQIEALSRKQLRDELVTLLAAGHETTALAMTWTWHLLSRYPEWESALQAELREVLGDRPPTYADLERLDLTRRIFSESMRLYPPAYATTRVATKETVLAGYPVEEGTEVIVWPYWAHHDARWFPDPERFDPDRFLPGANGIRHPHAYIPFGAGNRTCIGRHFAMMEGQLLLARLGQQFSLKGDGRDPGLRPRITLGPARPVRMTAHAHSD